jgi:hypothetical protein
VSKNGPPRIPLAERFWAKVWQKAGCWLWTGGRSGDGYGAISAGGYGSRVLKAHRVSWELHCGPLSPADYVRHTCPIKTCVNPDHLYLYTPREGKE